MVGCVGWWVDVCVFEDLVDDVAEFVFGGDFVVELGEGEGVAEGAL